MQNILVTGGAGFIGSNFIRHLLRADRAARIVNLDALAYTGSLENLKDVPRREAHTFVQGDICDGELVRRLLEQYEIDTIVHFAAESHVDRSILEPAPYVRTNITGTFTLLEAARRSWLPDSGSVRFHHVSTDEVFGSLGPGDAAWTEEAPYAPRSPYAASKASSDHLVRAYGHTYGLPYTLTNCSNNYGPFQFPEKLIPLMILNALEGRMLPVYGDGRQVRDWLHVEDHCEAIYLVLKNGRPGESYNLGGGNQPSNLAMVEAVCDILDELRPNSAHRPHRQLVRFVEDRPGHDRRYAMDFSKIRRELGWGPRHTLEQGLLDTVNWYLSHPAWVSAMREQQGRQPRPEVNYAARPSGGDR